MKTKDFVCQNALWVAAVILLAGCSYQATIFTRQGSSPQLRLTLNSEATGGKWHVQGDLTDMKRRGDWLNVRVEDPASSSVMGFGLRSDDIEFNLEETDARTPRPVRGTIRREAGTFSFEGEGAVLDAAGTFRFEPDPAFVQLVQPLLSQPPSRKEWLYLAFHEGNAAFIREVRNAGHAVSVSEILRLRHSGVSADYLTELRQGGCDFALNDIIKLRQSGVSADYAVGVNKAGPALPASEIISLRHSGVALEYYASLKKAAPALSVAQIIKLRHSGIAEEFFVELREILPSLSETEIIRLRHSGISIDYLKQWTGLDVVWEDVIRLRNAGVPVDYAVALKTAGSVLSPDQIIRLRHAGISSDYFAAIKKAGYDFSCDDLIKLRNVGVTPEYLTALHTPGQKNLPADVIMDLRLRGVPVETVKRIRSHSN